ncbi:hypothetical protein CTAYLR_002774 [Chrysophaeum taylorii]|uniref:Sulfotransferase n=1 Tax=Chrysophaeum taylorii TaxID=2483200 RepID=A0AAD7XL08_9STRA|nr:hypothetical protein CTAYLR_002774 [Chrysophaeum taylorii]
MGRLELAMLTHAVLWRGYDSSPYFREARDQIPDHLTCEHGTPKHVAQATLDAARVEIGLEKGKTRSTDGIVSQTMNWYSFWRYIPPQCVVAGTRGHCALYVPTVNVGVEEIRDTLLDGMMAIEKFVEEGNYVTLDRASCYSRDDNSRPQKFFLPDVSDMCYESIYVFTFVREPLQHFLAGYDKFIALEYGEVTSAEDVDRVKREIALDQNDPRAVIEKIVTGDMHWPNENAVHMSLMSGAFQNAFGKFDLIGNVHTIEDDWQKMLHGSRLTEEQYMDYVPPPRVFGQVAGGDDPLQTRAKMARILATNDTIRRAVCHVLTPDYRCFGYDVKNCIDGTALSADGAFIRALRGRKKDPPLF